MARADPPQNCTQSTATMEQPTDASCELLWLAKSGSGTVRILSDGPLCIGRGPESDVRIEDPSVSRAHATLHPGDPWEVEDLGSHNGTRVGGRRLRVGERAAVPTGTAVSIGEVVLVLHGSPSSKAPPSSSRLEQGGAHAMKELTRFVTLAARSDISVILVGETGVGKEVTAAQLHRASPRADKPFVALNCAALPEQLLESELFGYERGAFTGAVTPKPGLLEAAEGGTVLLDEIGELPLAVQPKLLRALETRQVMRLGGIKPRPFEARFVAATHRDLDAMVARGEFRSDLYYRLNGITLVIPPLRARADEIEPLAKRFVADACKRLGRPSIALSKAALVRLQAHGWPGNIRELKNVTERAVALCEGSTILPKHLALTEVQRSAEPTPPAADVSAAPSVGLFDELVDVERKRITEALARAGGNQTVAARLLGISRRTLVYRLGQLDLRRSRKGV